MAEAPVGLTRDALFGGRLQLEQPTKGHRVGTDAVLLASAVPAGFTGHVIDAGAGVGAVGLRIAQVSPRATVTLLENNPALAKLAAVNVAANGLTKRVSIATCDLLSREARRPLAGQAALVVTNPPFHCAARVRPPLDDGRRAAHVIGAGGLHAWLDACVTLLTSKGMLIVVHQAAALPELLWCLNPRLGAITILAVHPRAGQPAGRVLVRGIKGNRGPFQIAPPLVLHDQAVFSVEASKINYGDDMLNW